jgi:hypothetical protein
MGGWYKVVKHITGKYYLYDQRTYRVGSSVKTENRYIGPIDGSSAQTVKAYSGHINRALKSQKELSKEDIDYITRYSENPKEEAKKLSSTFNILSAENSSQVSPKFVSTTTVSKTTNTTEYVKQNITQNSQAISDNGVSPDQLIRARKISDAIIKNIGINPENIPPVSIKTGSNISISSKFFGGYTVTIPSPTKSKRPPLKSSNKSRKAFRKKSKTGWMEFTANLVLGTKITPFKRTNTTKKTVMTWKAIGIQAIAGNTALKRHLAKQNKKKISTNTTRTDPLKIEHQYRKALGRSMIDAISKHDPKRFKAMKKDLNGAFQEQKKILAGYQYNTRQTGKTALTLHTYMTGQISSFVRSKVAPEKFGFPDHDIKNNWKDDTSALISQVMNSGYDNVIAHYERQYNGAKSTENIATGKMNKLNFLDRLSGKRANAQLEINRANYRSRSIEQTIMKLAYIKKYLS